MKNYLSDIKGNNCLGPESPFDQDRPEEDLWFLPGPPEAEPDFLSPLPRAEADERAQIADWELAQAGQAARLADVAARLGALDDRLRRGPEGWRHRLALIEAAALSWQTGDRVTVDRLGLWLGLRIGAADDDPAALQRTGWAFRRLAGGPGPGADLAGFLGRHDADGSVAVSERIAGWQAVVMATGNLHPILRACFAFHLWPLAGIGAEGDRLEGAVIAARMAADDGQGGALFAPLAMGAPGGLRGGGDPADRVRRWLACLQQAVLKAMRHLDDLEQWDQAARARLAGRSGRTPPRLIDALRDWPLLTAPMAEEITGASRAAVQRNLSWLAGQGLVSEVTGQTRFRVWQAAL